MAKGRREEIRGHGHLPGAALHDLVATQTVLDKGTSYRTVSVGERTEPLGSDTPMRIVPEKRFEEVPPLRAHRPGRGHRIP